MENTHNINYTLCIICQSSTENGLMVQNPKHTSYTNLVKCLDELHEVNEDILNEHELNLIHLSEKELIKNNAIWHRNCYSTSTVKNRLDRLNKIKSPRGRKRKLPVEDDSVATISTSSSTYTRSHTIPYDKVKCFFCQCVTKEIMSMVHTTNAGKSLKDAVHKSENLEFITRLNSAISAEDAHAADIVYHLTCWLKHVTNVLAVVDTKYDKYMNNQMACLIETIGIIEKKVRAGKHVQTHEAEEIYISLLGGSEALQKHKPTYERRWLISQVREHLPSVTLVKHPTRNKPGYFVLPDACIDNIVKTDTDDPVDTMQQIYKLAHIIREDTIEFIETREEKNCVSVVSDKSDVNINLFSLIKWIIIGTDDECSTAKRNDIVTRHVLTICQNIMYNIKTPKQVKYTPKSVDSSFKFKRNYENPQVVGHSLSIHFDTRSKVLIDIASSEGSGIPYHRVINIETAIANAVIENCKNFDGIYVPPFLQRGKFVFFSTDNINFCEDTVDGKGITNATVVAVYQVTAPTGETISPPLCLNDVNENTLSPYNIDISPCNKPVKAKLLSVRGPQLETNNDPIDDKYKLQLLVWIMCSAQSRINANSSIPSWAGYNSLISNKLPITSTGVLPIIPESSTEYPTLLTVIQQTKKLKNLVVGDEHPVIISCDLAIYEKVLQILDVDVVLKNQIIPRIGGLHAAMAVLRGIGASIQNSGIDDIWQEADVYGPETTRQILKCNHYKRSLRAHLYTYHALFELELEQFLQDKPQFQVLLLEKSQLLNSACAVKDITNRTTLVKEANILGIESIQSELFPAFYAWEEEHNRSNAMFHSMTNYMHRVENLLQFIAASRSGDLKLHLQAGQSLSYIFFAFDRIKYKRLWPRYISDMHQIETAHPATWNELLSGNISVTESDIPFVSVDGDHATEHAVKCLKGREALTGISNDETCRLRYFLSSPELSRLVTAYKNQHDIEKSCIPQHHDLYPSAMAKEQNATRKIKEAIQMCGNPFDTGETDTLWNIVTHAYIPPQYVPMILNADKQGQQLYTSYVNARLNGNESVWEPVTKVNNRMYMSGKSSDTSQRSNVSDLRDTGELYARLLVLSNSGRDINIKHAIGTYEFTVTPRSLFNADGTMLPMNDKSKIIHALQKLPHPHIEDTHMSNAPQPSYKVGIIDASQFLRNPQKVKKTPDVKTILQLSHEYNRSIQGDRKNPTLVLEKVL